MTEESLGITEFLTTSTGFSCILKHRYEDFHVHEIDPDGNVVRLQNLRPGRLVNNSTLPSAVQANQPEADSSSLSDDNKDVGVLTAYQDELRTVLDGKAGLLFEIPCQDSDKATRTNIHCAVRKHFPGLETKTVADESGKSVIQVTKANPSSSSSTRKQWKGGIDGKKIYCHFTLYKENRDNFQALNQLCKLLRCGRGSFAIAGTKDKRAVTTQRASVFRQTPERMAQLNRILQSVRVGDFEYKDKPLKLGDNVGNRFTIVLRNILEDKKAIEVALQQWSHAGFINYFGAQRFGTTAISTHSVGRELLAENWKGAVDLILKSRDGNEVMWLKECRKIWDKTNDVEKCLKALPKGKAKNCTEGNLLYGLRQHGSSNYFQALKTIPRQQLSLYVHSYQSFVWNRVVSRRVQKYGSLPIKGDLIASDGKNAIPTVWDGTTVWIPSNKLVYPLPYPSAIFPDNEVRKWYDEILTEDGMAMDDFGKRHKDWALGESYRAPFIPVADLEHRFVTYTNSFLSLVDSDLDLLKQQDKTQTSETDSTALGKRRLSDSTADADGNAVAVPPKQQRMDENAAEGTSLTCNESVQQSVVKADDETPIQQSDEVKTGVALVVSFSLPSGAYATMALRELTKQQMTKQAQIALSDALTSDQVNVDEDT